MSEISEDMALEALFMAADKLAPLLNRQALKKAYQAGMAFQFEESRDALIRELSGLADEYVGGAKE